jgi:hypothetical protein
LQSNVTQDQRCEQQDPGPLRPEIAGQQASVLLERNLHSTLALLAAVADAP